MNLTIDLKDLPAALLLLSGLFYSIYAKKLTIPAAFTGLLCGVLLYLGSGYTGITLLTLCFLCGTIATSWGRTKKRKLAPSEDPVTTRKSSQVLANAGAATLISILMLVYPEYHDVLLVVLGASLASAIADTLSSELGVLYGRKFYNCLSWKRDVRGLDGVISVEGTLIGLGGALVVALLYSVIEGFNTAALIIIPAAVAGNFCDSVLGASLERRKILTNDWVNFLSTVFAGVVTLILLLLLGCF